MLTYLIRLYFYKNLLHSSFFVYNLNCDEGICFFYVLTKVRVHAVVSPSFR